MLWVQVYTDTGLVGLGETYYAPSVVAAAIHDWFGPLLIGRDPSRGRAPLGAMFRLSDHAGYGGAEMRAISALDIALWDIKGQALACRSTSCWAGPSPARAGLRDRDAVRGRRRRGRRCSTRGSPR